MIFRLFLSLSISFFIFPLQGMSHPGNTDSTGCHYCETNCSSWSVPWNQVHCHSTGASATNSRLFNASQIDHSAAARGFQMGNQTGQLQAQAQNANAQAIGNLISGIVGAFQKQNQQKNSALLEEKFRQASENYRLQYSDWDYYAPAMANLLAARIQQTSYEEALSYDPLEYYHAAKYRS